MASKVLGMDDYRGGGNPWGMIQSQRRELDKIAKEKTASAASSQPPPTSVGMGSGASSSWQLAPHERPKASPVHPPFPPSNKDFEAARVKSGVAVPPPPPAGEWAKRDQDELTSVISSAISTAPMTLERHRFPEDLQLPPRSHSEAEETAIRTASQPLGSLPDPSQDGQVLHSGAGPILQALHSLASEPAALDPGAAIQRQIIVGSMREVLRQRLALYRGSVPAVSFGAQTYPPNTVFLPLVPQQGGLFQGRQVAVPAAASAPMAPPALPASGFPPSQPGQRDAQGVLIPEAQRVSRATAKFLASANQGVLLPARRQQNVPSEVSPDDSASQVGRRDL